MPPLLTRAARAASRNRRENEAPSSSQHSKVPTLHKKGSPTRPAISPKSTREKLSKAVSRRNTIFHIQQATKHHQILEDRSATLNVVRAHKTPRRTTSFHPVVTGVCYLEDINRSEDADLDESGNMDGGHDLKACAGSKIFTPSNENQQQTYPRGILRLQKPPSYLELPGPTHPRDDMSQARGRASSSRAQSLNSRSPAPSPTSNVTLRRSSRNIENPRSRSRSRSRPRPLITPVDLNVTPTATSSLYPILISSNTAPTADLDGVPSTASRTARVPSLASDDYNDSYCVLHSTPKTPSLPVGTAAKTQSPVTVPTADYRQNDASDEVRRSSMTAAKDQLGAGTTHVNGAPQRWFRLPRNRVDRVLLWLYLVYFPIAIAMLGRIFGLV
ncbi:hypothetical protein C8Q80DRAFT_1265302 [Daedaleopsis nitida]|nr:hypothetical protein C8Q80DRAFT_1265302 [Daedaleopsis nitida]